MSNISATAEIEKTIISEAKTEAKRIVNEAEAAARQLLEDSQENAQANLTGWAERRKQMAQGSGDRILGKARNDAHMRVMNANAQMIDEIFNNGNFICRDNPIDL